MNVIIIGLIGLLCCTVQSGRGLVYYEGREAVLRFTFPRRDINVTLQIGNRYPFYSNHGGIGELLESGLYKDQIKRFQVKQYYTNSHYEMILNISNVSREDKGTYISLVYVDGVMITYLTKRIALVIEYPPGDPHCRYVSPSNIDVIRDTWDIIECTSAIGTMPGYIVCFQNDEALPIRGNLLKNSTTLSQQIWVKRDNFFSCCSSDYRGLVNELSCIPFQMAKVEDRPTTTFATYSTRGSSSYLTHDISTPFGEYYTNRSMFDNENDISTYKIFVTGVLTLAATSLVLLITTLSFIKLVIMERGIRGNIQSDINNVPELKHETNEKTIECFSHKAHPYILDTSLQNTVDNEQITRQEQRSTMDQQLDVFRQMLARILLEITITILQANHYSSQELKLRKQRTLSLPAYPRVVKNDEDTSKVVETSN